MTGNDIAATFEEHRAYLRGIAYRMLGSVAEAEDVVQDAYVRFASAPHGSIDDVRRYLATIVTRLALDVLGSARARRETYVGAWLPEPLATSRASVEPRDPASISFALLVVLESLSPLERAAFLLHDVFEYDHAEIASILDRDVSAVRQLVHRARENVRAKRPRFAPSRDAHERMLAAFAATVTSGDVDALSKLLASDVVVTSDGGGRVPAARKPIRGKDAVARFFVGLTKKPTASLYGGRFVDLNGEPALLVTRSGEVDEVIAIETDGEAIYALRIVRNPDKLGGVS